jgi:hypothetical protein
MICRVFCPTTADRDFSLASPTMCRPSQLTAMAQCAAHRSPMRYCLAMHFRGRVAYRQALRIPAFGIRRAEQQVAWRSRCPLQWRLRGQHLSRSRRDPSRVQMDHRTGGRHAGNGSRILGFRRSACRDPTSTLHRHWDRPTICSSVCLRSAGIGPAVVFQTPRME